MGNGGWDQFDYIQVMQGVCKTKLPNNVEMPTSVKIPIGITAASNTDTANADIAGVNTVGRAYLGHSKDTTANNFGDAVAWNTLRGTHVIEGRPTLIPAGDGTLIAAHLTNKGRVLLRYQKKDGSWTQSPTTYDVGGGFTTAPVGGANTTHRALFAVDTQGDLWASVSNLNDTIPFTAWTRATTGQKINAQVAPTVSVQGDSAHIVAATAQGIREFTYNLPDKKLTHTEPLAALPSDVTPRGLSISAFDNGFGKVLLTSTSGQVYLISQDGDRAWESAWTNVPLDGAVIEGTAAIAASPLDQRYIVARTKATDGPAEIISAPESLDEPGTFPKVMRKTPDSSLRVDPTPVTIRVKEGTVLMMVSGNGTSTAELWQVHAPVKTGASIATARQTSTTEDLQKIATFKIN